MGLPGRHPTVVERDRPWGSGNAERKQITDSGQIKLHILGSLPHDHLKMTREMNALQQAACGSYQYTGSRRSNQIMPVEDDRARTRAGLLPLRVNGRFEPLPPVREAHVRGSTARSRSGRRASSTASRARRASRQARSTAG